MTTRAVLAATLGALLLAGCAGFGMRQAPYRAAEKPDLPALGAELPAGGTAWSNASLAAVFTTLALDLEWQAERPGLVRLSAPVRVELEGPGAAQYEDFLGSYLEFLAAGTGIAIGRADPGAPANLHLRLVDGASFAQSMPAAACVVAPGDLSWREFRGDPSARGGDAMAGVRQLEQATIFVPANAPPHQIRGCMIEEIAQALGPANDLYGLGPSVFNDDAAHLWPTALDLLMLRVLYAPELVPGMDRVATHAAAGRALDRINPAGRAAPDLPFVADGALGDWRQVAQKIHMRASDRLGREDRARDALRLAAERAPRSPQHCYSLVALGRVQIPRDPVQAAQTLADARALCAAVHGAGDIRIARLRLDEGAARLAAGQPRVALELTGGIEGPLAGHAQDERLATLYALRARAYRALGQGEQAIDAQRLAAEWGAYAFGADNAALARALAP